MYSQRLLKINIGKPTCSDGVVIGTQMYSPNFSNGLVLVDPAATAYVTVGTGFTNAPW